MTTYRIVGADGRQYGPVSAAQIQQWIIEGRVDRRTPVIPQGAENWTYAGLVPEFAALFPAGTPPSPPPAVIAPLARARKTSGFATAGLVCGILALVNCCCYGFPFNILGLVFSGMALAQINRHPETYEGHALAVVGLVLSLVSILIYVCLLIWAISTNNFHFNWNYYQG